MTPRGPWRPCRRRREQQRCTLHLQRADHRIRQGCGVGGRGELVGDPQRLQSGPAGPAPAAMSNDRIGLSTSRSRSAETSVPGSSPIALAQLSGKTTSLTVKLSVGSGMSSCSGEISTPMLAASSPIDRPWIPKALSRCRSAAARSNPTAILTAPSSVTASEPLTVSSTSDAFDPGTARGCAVSAAAPDADTSRPPRSPRPSAAGCPGRPGTHRACRESD